MVSYRALEPSVFNDKGSGSTWINLGLWPSSGGGDYAAACASMARTVAALAGVGEKHRVLDAGCGCGDSLVLWAEMGCKHVTGVNVTETECRMAADKLRRAGVLNARVILDDALHFVERGLEGAEGGKFDRVVCVDALYHFKSRIRFLNALPNVMDVNGKFAAIDCFGSVDLLTKEELASKQYWKAWLHYPLRASLTALVSYASGIPFENICYSGRSLDTLLKAQNDKARLGGYQDVTARVFLPFSSHMFRVGKAALRSLDWSRAVQTIGAATFMRLMHSLGIINVAVYSLVFDA